MKSSNSEKRIASRAERAIEWAETYIRIPEGKFVGQPLKMAEFMKDDFRAIFDNPHGTRRAIITRGRKNAKSVETAILMLLFLVGTESQPNSQLYSCAQSRDQASILFNLASKMVRMSPDLSATCVLRDTAKQIFCPELGSIYRALSADASTAFGLSPRFVAFDELGQVRGPRSVLYEAMETATAAQEDPLTVIISTQAPTDSDILSVLIDDCAAGHDPKTVLRMNSAPTDLDPFSDEAIRAANPAFEIFMNKAEVRAMAQDARRMPSRESEYRNLVTNQRVEARSPFISSTIWKSNGGEVAPSFSGMRVWAGLDLSESADLTALVMVARIDGHWHVRPTFWLPLDGLAEKSRRDRVPYDKWAQDGYLLTSPGKSISYEWIARQLVDVFDDCDVQSVGFDRWGWRHLEPWIAQAGLPVERFVPFGQGFASMGPAVREFEALLLNGELRHGMHPCLTMCAANAVTEHDPSGARKLSKQRSSGRIDGMVALAMALSGAVTTPEGPRSIYQLEGDTEAENEGVDSGDAPDPAILANPRHPDWALHVARHNRLLEAQDSDVW